MAVTELLIQSTLKVCIDPNTGKDFISSKSAKNIQINGSEVSLDIVLGYPAKSVMGQVQNLVSETLAALPGVSKVTVNIGSRIVAHKAQQGVTLLPNVKNIIAVASGKGGVGKSTTSVNLALALAAEGATVGLLDADIYGPSQPHMLGISGRPESSDGKTMDPMQAHGIQAMSIGFLIDNDTPMVWRGPMVTGALEQLLRDTKWRDLDYLIIDLPPGTGDIQLTLAQKIPVTGAIIVTTPQDIALLDARKGLKMFEKVSIPILGIVENMSTHICSQCGFEEHIFGAGGGATLAVGDGVGDGHRAIDVGGRGEAEGAVRIDGDGALGGIDGGAGDGERVAFGVGVVAEHGKGDRLVFVGAGGVGACDGRGVGAGDVDRQHGVGAAAVAVLDGVGEAVLQRGARDQAGDGRVGGVLDVAVLAVGLDRQGAEEAGDDGGAAHRCAGNGGDGEGVAVHVGVNAGRVGDDVAGGGQAVGVGLAGVAGHLGRDVAHHDV